MRFVLMTFVGVLLASPAQAGLQGVYARVLQEDVHAACASVTVEFFQNGNVIYKGCSQQKTLGKLSSMNVLPTLLKRIEGLPLAQLSAKGPAPKCTNQSRLEYTVYKAKGTAIVIAKTENCVQYEFQQANSDAAFVRAFLGAFLYFSSQEN